MRHFFILLSCGAQLCSLFAAGKEALPDTVVLSPKTGTVADSTLPSSDSTTLLQTSSADSSAAENVASKQDSVLIPATPAKKTEATQAAPAKPASSRKIKLIKREYNYRQQVGLAVGMMAFIAIMMTTAQSWNPK